MKVYLSSLTGFAEKITPILRLPKWVNVRRDLLSRKDIVFINRAAGHKFEVCCLKLPLGGGDFTKNLIFSDCLLEYL